ncbi:MAG TPA: hypothetical protein VHD69_02805 [Candidatus Paceibacterota bacterium]|nr:hypothetical protein [Candidatus Paceibacterota bacterium]
MTLRLAKPLVYVTRDIERALGMEPGQRGGAGYFVVSNDTAYGREVEKKYPDYVRLVQGGAALLDTFDILSLPEIQKMIADLGADVLVFQNTARIERLVREKGWDLLNPRAELAKEVEEKVSQVKWLGDQAALLPPHRIALCKDVAYRGAKFVIQFNHSHTGEGTHVIKSDKDLADIRERFPLRECRVTDFVEGPVFTMNIVVGDDIIMGNPSYQITGLRPFTDLPFSTVGNDWTLAKDPGFLGLLKAATSIARTIGSRLKSDGWKGLFGIDVIYDTHSGKTSLLEINARQPASATFESTLEKEISADAPTIFEAHVAALLGMSLTEKPPSVSGAQIVKRVTNIIYDVDIAALRAKDLDVMTYDNVDHNKELFRIQSSTGIMKAHGILNDLGISIASCIKTAQK